MEHLAENKHSEVHLHGKFRARGLNGSLQILGIDPDTIKTVCVSCGKRSTMILMLTDELDLTEKDHLLVVDLVVGKRITMVYEGGGLNGDKDGDDDTGNKDSCPDGIDEHEYSGLWSLFWQVDFFPIQTLNLSLTLDYLFKSGSQISIFRNCCTNTLQQLTPTKTRKFINISALLFFYLLCRVPFSIFP